jgi:hypothetical protein
MPQATAFPLTQPSGVPTFAANSLGAIGGQRVAA